VSPIVRFLIAAIAGCSILVSGTGCGGSKHDSEPVQRDSRKPPRSAEIPPPRLRAPDKKAYAVIQKTSGDLRAAAIPATYGSTAGIATDQLSSDVRKLDAQKPRNSLLKRLLAETRSAVTAAIAQRSGAPARASAKAAIAEADRIDAGLRRYAASHPAANEITPG
jgi:hypothetical protein